MKIVRLLSFLFLLAACTSAEQENPPDYDSLILPHQPNILWLVAEDMSPTIAAYGDSTIHTPNLDRLFKEGVRYTHMFSVSGVCAPSRFSIATGIYTTRGGAQHMRTSSRPEYMEKIGVIPYEATPDPPVRMMSEVMRENGYYTTNRSKQDYQFKAPVTAWDENSPRAHWRNRPEGMPFFSIVNFGVTHESQIWARANDTLLVAADAEVPIPPYLPSTDLVYQDVRRMYSNILRLDARIGDVLEELESDNLLEETIIVFYSDHGGPLPRQKRQLYDSGLHVPLAIRFPNQQLAGMTDDQLISFVDLAPTTFSLAGIPLPEYLDGQAFLGTQRAGEQRWFIHAAADRFDAEYDTKRAIRDQRYKYILNLRPDLGYYLAVSYREQMATMQELLRLRDLGELDEYQAQWFRESKPEEELFDTENDPYELRNLAYDPIYSERLALMRTELENWMADTGDPGAMDEMEFVATLWPNHTQPQTADAVIEIINGGELVSSFMEEPLLYEVIVDPGKDTVRLRLESTTEGASIGYQILEAGGSLQDRWLLYTSPITVPVGRTLKAVAHRIGYAPSTVVTAASRLRE